MNRLIKPLLVAAILLPLNAVSQVMNQMDDSGNITQRGSGNFNPHSNDTTRAKQVPKGIYVWTVDQRFGDVRRTDVDTIPHLYPQSTLATGMFNQYQTIGSNYTARLNRIFTDRKPASQFLFLDSYSQMLKEPWEWHFTNTLSPITNLSYGSCGDKTNGEDLIDARFAVNAGKQTGLGFDLDYRYARGYYQNQSNSHFGATFYVSHLGDRYQLHALFQTNHQKASENGGITNDDYITHPELFTDSYSDNEIPTQLSRNWNRHHHLRFFLSHRYAVGFYRRVPMTEEEIEARRFAQQQNQQSSPSAIAPADQAPAGRPDNAPIAGSAPLPAPVPVASSDSLSAASTDSLSLASGLPAGIPSDSTRIQVSSKQQADSLIAAQQAAQLAADSIDQNTKLEFVPVTSFIHTLDLSNRQRTYLAYETPQGYYADTYYNYRPEGGYAGDSISDLSKMLNMRNTVAIALLEGFNKYAPAGLKAFLTHELRRFDMPDINADSTAFMGRWTEHNISIGGQIVKAQGNMLHYNATFETWIAGEDAGQMKLDAEADLNFQLLGDTAQLRAMGYLHRLNPTFLQRNYHAKHLWWDNDFDKETRTHIEGSLHFGKTKTRLRVAIDNITNYTYLTENYSLADEAVQNLSAAFVQSGDNISILTAQIDQRLQAGPLHWDNIVTWQKTSDKSVLPLPQLNIFTNLYLKFLVAHVLSVELGASGTWFTEYEAPQFLPQMNQYAIQQNPDTRMKIGNFPFVDVYANLHLKHARFFVMINNVLGNNFSRQSFLTPHYPLNRSVMHLGISWNFFN
ncbi:MAG: putative porin [Prevotella sp.]|nr:putative porin [Prevotella sp.]